MLSSCLRACPRLESAVKAVGKAASDVRQKLGESEASIQKFDVPVEEATTSSLEALKSFTTATDLEDKGQQLATIPLLQHALGEPRKVA